MSDQGARYDQIDLGKGLSPETLEALIGDRDYRRFLNTRNELYRERNMKDHPPPRSEAIRLMSENPNLIKRPILVKGGRIVLGFDEAAMRELL